MSTFAIPKFPVVKQSLHADLKKRVQAYFDEQGIKSTGTPKLFTKAIVMIILGHFRSCDPWWFDCRNWI
jgi:linoleoyl-CoA desaturase